jgi:hypothetical protein
MSSSIFAPIVALGAAAVRGLALPPPLLRLLILCLALAALLLVPPVSRRAHEAGVRIESSRQCRKKLGARGLQFCVVRMRQPLKQRFSTTREGQHDFAAVCLAARTTQQALCFQAIRQLDCAVMLNQQPLGQHSDGGQAMRGQALDRKQRLVLLRLDAGGIRLPFTEIQETPNFKAEIRKHLVINGP